MVLKLALNTTSVADTVIGIVDEPFLTFLGNNSWFESFFLEPIKYFLCCWQTSVVSVMVLTHNPTFLEPDNVANESLATLSGSKNYDNVSINSLIMS